MSDEMREKVARLNTLAGQYAQAAASRDRRQRREVAATRAADLYDVLAELERVERKRDEAQELTSCAVTVGNGLSVYGTVEAIGRVQDYILLDSRHPVEAADVRRSLARALQAAEARATAAETERDQWKADAAEEHLARKAAEARLAEAVEVMRPVLDAIAAAWLSLAMVEPVRSARTFMEQQSPALARKRETEE